MPSNTVPEREASGRFPTLGIFWILYGILRVIAAVLMFVYSATATLMFGALLNRVANPFALMDLFHFVYLGAIVLAAVGGAIGILAGLAMMSGSGSARTLGLIAGFLALYNLPLGTTLGIYTLIVLLQARTTRSTFAE